MRRWIISLFLLGAAVAQAGVDLGPIFEQSSNPTNGASFFAIRPFYSHAADPAHERWRSDYLWPLYTRKGFKDEQYGRLLFFGYSADFSSNTERERIWILPFFMQGTDQHGKNYFALFPLGGILNEFLMRDRISFVLFPLYASSQINEVKTTSVLWPIYSKTTGDRVDRFRVWPFYGRSSLTGEFEKRFVCWPFYSSVEYVNERNPGRGFLLFPLYGHVEKEHSETTWVLPPFFRFSDSARQRLTHAPWPFVQLADGEINKRMFWPIYGKKEVGTLTKEYFVWPLIWNNKAEQREYVRHRKYVFPLFTHVKDVATAESVDFEEGQVVQNYWKLWPLMSHDRQGDRSRFRLLDLWPLRNTPGVERNWSPFWTLYKRTEVGDAVDHHVFWWLYRQASAPDAFEWSLLHGVAGYKKSPNNREFRILFKWFGGEKQP